jgi:TatD DNase family protein
VSPGLIDTHAHLDGPEYAGDLDEVVSRAEYAGVSAAVCAGQDYPTSVKTLALAERFPGIVAPAVGVHPHLAKDAGDMSWLAALLDNPRVVAAGEMGLDYHYDFSPRDRQREVFERQLELAAARALPAIVHCREAYDDVIAILRSHRGRGTTVVVHCFTASYDVGIMLIEQCGAFLGIGGAVTFKKATDLHDAVQRLPLEQLVLETDCPYMTPVPHRGKRNEPAYLPLTCAAVAALRAATADEIATVTTANAMRLFPKLAATTGAALARRAKP